MSEGVLARLRALLGDSGVAAGIDGTPRAMPESTEDVAEVMQLAHAEGWKVRVEGQATWLGPDAPAQLALSTRALSTGALSTRHRAPYPAPLAPGTRHNRYRGTLPALILIVKM